MPAQLTIEPLDHRRQGVVERQAVGDDLPRHRGQLQFGEPAAPWPGPVAPRPVIPVIRGDRVNPVPQLGTEPDQAGPVLQLGAETGWIPVKLKVIQLRLICVPQ